MGKNFFLYIFILRIFRCAILISINIAVIFLEREKKLLENILNPADNGTTAADGKPNGPQQLPIGETTIEHCYIPTVGRWGCEWPS